MFLKLWFEMQTYDTFRKLYYCFIMNEHPIFLVSCNKMTSWMLFMFIIGNHANNPLLTELLMCYMFPLEVDPTLFRNASRMSSLCICMQVKFCYHMQIMLCTKYLCLGLTKFTGVHSLATLLYYYSLSFGSLLSLYVCRWCRGSCYG